MLTHLLLIGSIGAAALLWASVFGYIAVLRALAARRRRAPRRAPEGEVPELTVVIPVYNEERYIAGKLADLGRADYPRHRLRVLVVDRGSTDRTARLVDDVRAAGDRVEWLQVAGARGKSEQLNAAFARVTDELIVVTDADTRLAPGCLRELVGMLQDDPTAEIVGARVWPATGLLEERIHWWVLNWLWWLEGEALGQAMVSGVCFALRRAAAVPLPGDCAAEDVHLALAAAARGGHVRLCRSAVATELRVPQTAREFLRFRHRRGSSYIRELQRVRPADAPLRWHCLRWLRLGHFLLLPALSALVAAGALILCATPHWRWTLAMATAFAVPAFAALAASTTLGGSGPWWYRSLAAGRLAGLTWFALLALHREPDAKLVHGE